jgi:hypothetical protein
MYLVGKNASLVFWVKRLMPDALWGRLLTRSLR